MAGGRDFGWAPTGSDAPPPFAGIEVLRQNVPNPFNPRTVIEFEPQAEAFAELSVYDVAGRWVETLVRDRRPAGTYRVGWNGEDAVGREVASGVYYYVLRTEQGRWVRRMTLLR